MSSLTISSSTIIKNSIHQDGWTETLDGITYLIKQIALLEETGESFQAVILLRLTIICSSYLAEQVFNNATNKYYDQKLKQLSVYPEDMLKKEELIQWGEKNSLKTCGISRAMREWPEFLTGKKFELGKGTLQSLKYLTKTRNDIIHEIHHLTHYQSPLLIAKQALFTAVEACKEIEKHFFSDQEFSYIEWIKEYPIEQTTLFNTKNVKSHKSK